MVKTLVFVAYAEFWCTTFFGPKAIMITRWIEMIIIKRFPKRDRDNNFTFKENFLLLWTYLHTTDRTWLKKSPFSSIVFLNLYDSPKKMTQDINSRKKLHTFVLIRSGLDIFFFNRRILLSMKNYLKYVLRLDWVKKY